MENRNPSARNQNKKFELRSNAKWRSRQEERSAVATDVVVVAVAAAKYYLLVALLLLLSDLYSSHS